MATDIIARGMAANAKKSVTELGNKVESEKWIGTKAEWEAVDKSTIKDGTIVYITDDKTVILYDKAEMEKIAAQVAADRKAAETAAQTAQSVADSLPDDYVTAVAKIAKNTEEIASVKLSDKELQRRVNALYSIGQGITHQFETDTDTAYVKTIPTGGKLMSVKSVGGRSIVWNQLVDSNIVISETTRYSFNGQHLTTNITDGLSLSDDLCTLPTIPVGHKVLIKVKFIAGNVGNKEVNIGGYHKTTNKSWQCKIDLPKNIELAGKTLIAMDTTTDTAESIRFFLYNATIPLLTNIDCYINYYDLTLMFGSGNEPTSVEEFEKMFPADYYPYAAGEIVSAGVESIVKQGKNLFDYTDKIYYGANVSKVENGVIYTKGATTTVLNIPTIVGSKYTLSFKVKSSGANQGGLRWSLQTGKNTSYAHDSSLIKSEVGYVANTEYQAVATFVATTDFVSLCTIMPMVYDVQLENGDTATGYSPFYQTEYPIPEAIKALLGYGWSAGTAKNYVDYENKRYVQCVGSVDLGTLSWRVGDSVSFETFQLKGQKLTKNYDIAPNILCSKYPTKTQNELWGKTNVTGITTNANVDGYVYVNDTAYTDATAFKQAMQGVMLYYELETPIVTDISDLIDDDFLRNIEVEAGGSITFKNSNDNYHIPVPSEEEYIVKLSEVGGTA